MSVKIIHICPVGEGGISDYVDVCVQHQPGSVKFPLSKASAQTANFSGSVLLHLSGYGYHKRGAPLWLLNKLQADRSDIRRLGVYFHELYAFGTPWRSAFWMSPLQRYIVRRIANISDFWITNREDSAVWLRRSAGSKPNIVLPVFSNIGESSAYSPKRLPRIIVFGSAALRAATYRAAGESLFKWARTSGLELHDIGPTMSDQSVCDSLKKAGAILHGRLDAHEASSMFSDASFGVVAYKAHEIEKSGVFAAYCAHGLCPILINPKYSLVSGLSNSIKCLQNIPSKMVSDDEVRNNGYAAWSWYQSHCVKKHVATQLSLEAEQK